MNEYHLHQVFRWIEVRGLIRGPRLALALMLTLCLMAIGSCSRRPDPLQKAFDAVGGREAILELRGFGYESTGDRFEPEQGPNPEADPIRVGSFDLSLLCDVENDRLSLDWRRQILDPLRGALAYKDVLDGDLGYQTGNDSVFNPPDASLERALPSERIAAVRREFRLLNPLLYLRAAAAGSATTLKADEELQARTHHVIEVADPVYPVELLVDAESGLVAKLRTLQNDHLWGDVVTEVSYGEWSSPEGSNLQFPHRVELAVAGQVLHTASRSSVVVNPEFAADAFSLAEEPRTQVDPGAAERAGLTAQYHTRWHALGVPVDQDATLVTATAVGGDPEVLHLTGAFHHSLAIKLDDAIVVVEPPLNEARSKAVLAKLEELWPGLPVSHLILTHHHYDHMGGIRTYAARGATIVTSALNSAYVGEALTSTHSLVPDELAGAESPEWEIAPVPPDEEFSLEADGRTIKTRHVPSIHNEDMLVVYLPESRLLFVSDLYMPAVFPVGQPMPGPFGDWSQGLREGLATLEWEVDWIAGGHGGVDSIADFHSHFDS